MRDEILKLSIDRNSDTPVYLQIRNRIRDMIVSGELPAGYILPPERRLAEMLDVNRSTVLNAYRELKADDYIKSHMGQGTVVLSHIPNDVSSSAAQNAVQWRQLFSEYASGVKEPLLRDLMELASRDDVISFAAGIVSPELFSADSMEAVMKKLLAESGATAFLHAPTEGYYPLRESLSLLLSKRGMPVSPDEVLVLSGSQQGLDLAARVFIDPGDVVIVEEPTFFCALQVFKAAGAKIIEVPVDENGMRVDLLEPLLTRYKPKMIYTLPTFQNPSGAVMSLERRHALLELSAAYQIPVLEDDPYGELRYEGHPIPALKALDRHCTVMYLSTFSKILYPGLRLGWLSAPRQVISKFTLVKQMVDLHSNSFAQYLADEIIRQDLLGDHVSRSCKVYARQRDAMMEALMEYLPEGVQWNKPHGGFYLWCKLPDYISMQSLIAKASDQGVAFVPGDVFFNSGQNGNYIRLNYSYHTPESIKEGIKRLSIALNQIMAMGLDKGKKTRIQIRPIV